MTRDLRPELIRAELLLAALVASARSGMTPEQVADAIYVAGDLVDGLEAARHMPAPLDLAAIRRDGGPRGAHLRVVQS